MSKYVIVLEKEGVFETWSSLTGVCNAHKFSYNYLKSKKFPFEYKGFRFVKCKHNIRNI